MRASCHCLRGSIHSSRDVDLGVSLLQARDHAVCSRGRSQTACSMTLGWLQGQGPLRSAVIPKKATPPGSITVTVSLRRITRLRAKGAGDIDSLGKLHAGPAEREICGLPTVVCLWLCLRDTCSTRDAFLGFGPSGVQLPRCESAGTSALVSGDTGGAMPSQSPRFRHAQLSN